MNEKIQKLRRILAEGSWSSDNEKKIARSILEKYKAMGIDVDTAFEEVVKLRPFPFRWWDRNIEKVKFAMIILKNFIEPEIIDDRRLISHKDYQFEFELTESEYVEALARFEFYWRDYVKQKKENEKVFLRAYIQRNSLYCMNDGKPFEPTKEQMELAMKADLVSGTISRAQYLKRIWSPS